MRFRAPAMAEIDGISCSAQAVIQLYPDGQLMVCQLHKDQSLSKHSFSAGTKLVIDEYRNVFEYDPDIHQSIQSHINQETFITDKVLELYDLRMIGKINLANSKLKDERNDFGRNPMVHFEDARIRRHKLMGGAPKITLQSMLNTMNGPRYMHRHNVVIRYFDADCASFAACEKLSKGDSLTARRYYLRALEDWNDILRMKPVFHAARLNLVDIYSRNSAFLCGDREKAEMHAGVLIDYDSVWGARAASILLPDDASRLDFWLDFEKSHPDDPVVLYELGRAHLADDDPVRAEQCYRRAMELDSSRIILLVDLARYHLMKARENVGETAVCLEASETFFMEYLETEPIQPIGAWCYASLARLKEMAGDETESVRLRALAKSMDPWYFKGDRLPPMLLYTRPGTLSNEYYSYFDKY
jgi:hypothetical protein